MDQPRASRLHVRALPVRALWRTGLALVFLPILLSSVGCGGKNKFVTGKVLLDGQPVAGEVIFIGPSKRKLTTPIAPDGTYTISDPDSGENQVLVVGLPGAGPPPGKRIDPRTKAEIEKMQSALPDTSGGVEPPKKYAKPGNGLTFNVLPSGKQEYNINLEP